MVNIDIETFYGERQKNVHFGKRGHLCVLDQTLSGQRGLTSVNICLE